MPLDKGSQQNVLIGFYSSKTPVLAPIGRSGSISNIWICPLSSVTYRLFGGQKYSHSCSSSKKESLSASVKVTAAFTCYMVQSFQEIVADLRLHSIIASNWSLTVHQSRFVSFTFYPVDSSQTWASISPITRIVQT